MFGRLVMTRRYIKVIIISFITVPILLQGIYLLHTEQYTLQDLKTAHEKLPSISTVNEYLKNFDSKGLQDKIFGLGGTNKTSDGYNDDDAQEGKEQEDTSTDLPEYLNADKSLKEEFFRTFKDHNNDVSKTQWTNENIGLYKEWMAQKISEPKVDNLVRPAENVTEYDRESATLMSLVRNAELEGIITAMIQVEQRFNKKFNYPWTFINDVEFTEDFKERVQAETKAECFFVTIPKELWDKPENIDFKKEKAGIEYLKEKGIGYADMESYHNMCRFYSASFYKLEHMKKFKYYWRVEPETKYFCEIDYDVFKFMRHSNKIYGFNINLYDGPDSIRTLWNETIEFLKQGDNAKYINKKGAYNWLLEDMQNPEKHDVSGYSTCHFWSNFEIGDMDFYRGEAYTKWMEHLEKAGGFYYERWGDAPVHSIALALFADKSQIHWFRDIGYYHSPYFNCPLSDKCTKKCRAGKFIQWENLNSENCMGNWIRYGMSDDEKEMF